MRRGSRTLVLVMLALLAGASGASAASSDFPAPQGLRPQISFWKKVFGVYSEHQILIHDTERLSRVYAVLDYRALANGDENPVVVELTERAGMASEKERIRRILLDLDARGGNDGGLNDEERRIWNLFAKDKDPRKFALAADPDRIRTQRGLKERFSQGVRVSRRYLPEMEDIFRRQGLPVELTRLPLVESCFDIDAYSKVGAAGIWQFMRSTGRHYMVIGGVLDERRDPLRATHGAARHLKENYEELGSWPLAITAYNHGRAGVARAARETGTTDIATIVRKYRGPLFGFASRNFYAEFVAALEVEANYRDYFGELQFEKPFKGDEVRLPEAVSGQLAASCAEVSPLDLALLNPAVDQRVFTSSGNLPRGYVLRVPAGTSEKFQQRLAQVAADGKPLAIASASKKTRSSAKASAKSAARDTAKAATKETKQTVKASTEKVETAKASTEKAETATAPAENAEQQTVKAEPEHGEQQAAEPEPESGEQRTAKAEATSTKTHKVGKGQTLSHIAKRYRVSVKRLMSANSLRGNKLKPGQVLKIPTG